jgi:hypothetical protein
METVNTIADTAVISKKEARRTQMEKIILAASSSKGTLHSIFKFTLRNSGSRSLCSGVALPE